MPPRPTPTVASVAQDVAVVQTVQSEIKDDIKEIKEKVDRPPVWITMMLSGSAALNGALITALFTIHH